MTRMQRLFDRVRFALFYTLLGISLTPRQAQAFEQDQRVNSLTLQFGTDTFATSNAFGGAFAGLAQSSIQSDISSHVADGSVSILFEMPGLTDLTGTSAPALQIGVVDGSPVLNTNNPAVYSGTNDLDWWYIADPDGVDAEGVPKVQISGSIAAGLLTASAPELSIVSPLGGGVLAMSGVVLMADIGSTSAPLESTNGFPPGHLPSEHINPALLSFASMTNGQWKGNISAAALAAIPYNLTISTDQGYTSSNSMLDLLVSGATTFGFIRLVYPTQPDQVDTNAPLAGAGPPYRFTVNASKMVTGCLDRTGTAVPLAAALESAAYSAYFTFTTDRVIVHNVTGTGVKPPSLSIAAAGTNVVLNVAAQDTVTCTIQYKNALTDPNWLWLQTFTGTGGTIRIVDPNATRQSRFYRVGAQ